VPQDLRVGSRMLIRNPADDTTIAEVEPVHPGTVPSLASRARRAQRDWGAARLEERLDLLEEFRRLVEEHSEDLARTLTRETGKPIAQARNELAGTLPRLDFFLANTASVLADEPVDVPADSDTQERITHEPLGVVANISAWNYPWFVGTNVFIPALLTGNAVLYKPSELATMTGLAIAELLRDAGAPRDVFTTVVGGGDVGAALVGTGPDGLFFTGSYPTGRRIAEAYAPHLGVLQLELGGKDPAYVAADAEPETTAAALADGAFYNNGQSCCAVERIYVHDSVHDRFVDAFVEVVRGMVMGDPMAEDTYLGPLTRPAQADLLAEQVEQARSLGATVACGGHQLPGPGTWFEPTVLLDVDHRMDAMREESFGPLIGIQRVADDEEAVELMADTGYGLTAGVFTPSQERAEHLLSGLDVGSAYWNCCDRVSPTLPWSGRRHSGVGSTLSLSGIRSFTRPKAWHLRGG
jgi:acyl-CoA reductase-like NAD-dependent aldehyde dehydrogenase